MGDEVLRVPASGYYFNNTDCWARVEGGIVKVGFSDAIRFDPRAIVSFEEPEVGEEVRIYEELCSFGTDRGPLKLNAPMSGRVISVNPDVKDDPGLIKEDPYERGWVVELEPSDIDDDMDLLMDAEQYLRNTRARAASGPGCPCTWGRGHAARKAREEE